MEQLRRDRDRTRAELGRSVEALSERLDVATRTRDRMHRAAHSAQDNAQRAGARAQENAIPWPSARRRSSRSSGWCAERARRDLCSHCEPGPRCGQTRLAAEKVTEGSSAVSRTRVPPPV
ncbi:DUF3618 domain-containing protein [Nocardia veterana]|uniref:DUF3618 domain-containing protein n=1 Tax=Nocardia veterana TaxID=132249 RepID=UPI0035E3ED04